MRPGAQGLTIIIGTIHPPLLLPWRASLRRGAPRRANARRSSNGGRTLIRTPDQTGLR